MNRVPVINPATGAGYRFKDRTGKRSGRLVFTRVVGETRHKHKIWEAKCDCGVVTQTASPHSAKSCGCLHRENSAESCRERAQPDDVRLAKAKANVIKQRARRRRDPLCVMQSRLSRLHRHALAQVGAIKTSPTFEALGYTASEFVTHIEAQFCGGMGWHNMADWQIDHIIPMSSARSVDDVVALNQLSNLRPLWASENNAKKDKRDYLL